MISVAKEARVDGFRCTLDASRPHIELWGTRGSTPTVGARFQRHGGNTSCLSLTFGDDVMVFDAGSGIRDLGIRLAAHKPRKLHLFITHPHWDHIQGFPFSRPLTFQDLKSRSMARKASAKIWNRSFVANSIATTSPCSWRT